MVKKGDYENILEEMNRSYSMKHNVNQKDEELAKLTARLEASHKEIQRHINRESELENRIDGLRTEHRKIQTELAEKCSNLETKILNDKLSHSKNTDKLMFQVRDFEERAKNF